MLDEHTEIESVAISDRAILASIRVGEQLLGKDVLSQQDGNAKLFILLTF